MPQDSSGSSRSVLWADRPWILPGVLARSVLIAVVAVVAFWFESFFGVANWTGILGIGAVFWTILVLFLVWIFSLVHLLLLRASNKYTLRNDSLEIRSGIVTSRSFVVVASGFSDLEVIRSISGRILNSGDIIISTQGEIDSDKKMVKVRNPLKVADQIRGVMARQVVRIEGQEPTGEKK